MNIVTFETARKLKEVGFPQPEPAFGQFWYIGKSQPVFITGADKSLIYYAWGEWREGVIPDASSVRNGPEFYGADPIFAPNVTDLLPPDCFLAREISYKTASGERWVIYDRETMQVLNLDNPDSDNAAEVAASAWLTHNTPAPLSPNSPPDTPKTL